MKNNFNCIIVDDELDAIILLESSLTSLYKNIQIEGKYTQWQEAFIALKKSVVDLIFLDISMPGKNGFDFLKLLPDIKSEVIFITAHEDHALTAFQFAAAGYVLKPIDDAMLMSAVDKAIERIQYKHIASKTQQIIPHDNLKIGIPNNQDTDYVNVDSIIYFETNNKCTNIVTIEKTFISSYNIGKYKSILDSYSCTQFYQVHRSYIINMDFIVKYNTSGYITMSNNKMIPLSKNVKTDFLRHFPNPDI